jgi:hypothetical protein
MRREYKRSDLGLGQRGKYLNFGKESKMNFANACARAKAASLEHPGCAIHVNALIIPEETTSHQPVLDESGYRVKAYPVIEHEGYTLSDWVDGTTVRTFVDGREINGRFVPTL